MKNIIKIILFSMLLLSTAYFVGADFSADIIPTEAGTVASVSAGEGTGTLDRILGFVRDSIFGILGLVAIGMFLYVGFNLVKAQGNPEEMKKAFMTLIHVIVGLFIVAISWALIKMVSGIIL